MNIKFGLALRGHKGLFTLRELVRNIGLLPELVTIRPSFEKDDPELQIVEYCRKHKIEITFTKTFEEYHINNTTIYVGWDRIIDHTKPNTYIIHDSELPAFKGFCPTVQALLNGRKNLSSTLFIPTKEMDDGIIVTRSNIQINNCWKDPCFIHRAMKVAGINNAKCIERLFSDDVKPIGRRFGVSESYSLWRDKEDYYIDFKNNSSVQVLRFIRAVGYPYHGAKIKTTKLFNCDAVVSDAEEYKGYVHDGYKHAGKILKIVDGCPVVVCGKSPMGINYSTYGSLIKLKGIVDPKTDQPIEFTRIKTRL